MNRFITICAATLLATGLVAAPAMAAQTADKAAGSAQTKRPDPQKVAKRTVQKVMSLLDKHRQTYKKHPQKLYAMINEVLVPHFDVDFMAKLVLGQHWDAATPEQRKRFTRLFKNMLVHKYGTALLAFGDQKIEYLRCAPGRTQRISHSASGST